MATRRETLRLLRDLRTAIANLTDTEVRQLVQAWARAWDESTATVRAALDELATLDPDRGWPTRMQIMRSRKALHALEIAERHLQLLSDRARISLHRAAAEAARMAAAAQPGIIASQLPAGSQASLAARFDRMSPEALAAIVERSTEQITALTRPLSAGAREAMLRELIRGVTLGLNPRAAASAMLRRLEGVFNGGLTRALVIARTEILDASRLAAAAQQAANADVLAGWVWTAELGPRTCPACLAQHGSVHPLSEPGPLGHPSCRCSRTPVTKSWKQLGFTTAEPPGVLPDAQAWFNQQSQATQVGIMGQARLELLRSGRIDWADLGVRRSTTGWRDSWQVRPVTDLLRRAAAA